MHPLIEAKEEGLVRHLGISGHTDPAVQVEALRRFPFDSVLFSASVLDSFHERFVQELLPAAQAAGSAVIAMRVLAGGKLKRAQAMALRYTMSLPVSVVLVGCSRKEHLDQALAVA
jgi:aryl-alcohol dehydrogenase-like predicted oxidoreductase